MILLPRMPCETFSARYVTVQDRYQNYVPAVPLPGQLRLYRTIEDHRDPRTGAFRAVHLKSRRSGGTKGGLTMILQDICETGTTKAAIMLHEEKVTQRTLADFKGMLQALPDRDIPSIGWRKQYRPVIDGDSQDHVSFKDRAAIVFISTARAKGFGAGDDISFFLWSEVAKVEKAISDRIVSNVLPALTPNAKVIWDSTPDEINGDYYPGLWKNAKKPGSDKIAIFNPWWMDPFNRVGDPGDWDSLGALWEEEKRLKGLGLGADRCLFRRAMCEQLDVTDPGEDGVGELLFDVQYPGDDVRCFTGIRGKPYYDLRVLAALQSRATNGVAIDRWEEPEEKAA